MKAIPRCLGIGLLLVLASGLLSAADDVRIQTDVVYGHKDGLALTFDVIKPAKPNGAGILWLQSGGWYSSWRDPKVWPILCKPHLDKGFTMFIVRHGSAPKYTVPEAIEDVRRCVRFIRTNGKEFGIDSDRLGVFGSSAGGHLSLMLGTTGDDGNPKAPDEVLRGSSRVAAVVAICPPTDLRGWVKNPPPAIKAIPGLKPPLSFDAKKEPDCSPLLKARARTAPTLLIHGDKDTLVPIEHSKNMLAALEKEKVACKLLTIEDGEHSFTPKQHAETVLPAMLEWFEKYLAAKKE